MRFNKKGQASTVSGGWALKLLVAAISLAIIGFVTIGFYGDESFFGEIGCKFSVYMADQTGKSDIFDIANFMFPIICSTGDKVVEEDEKIKVVGQLVEHMRKCWDMWGEGDLDPAGTNWIDDEFKCFKCYRISFPDYNNEGSEGSISMDYIRDYMKNPRNNVRGYNDNFMNYFKGNVMFSPYDEYVNDFIRPDEEYAIIFVEDVDGNDWTRYSDRILTGAIFGGSVCFFSGAGTLFTPICLVKGAGAGFVWAVTEHVVGAVDRRVRNLPEGDMIMVTRYDDANLCGGYIE